MSKAVYRLSNFIDLFNAPQRAMMDEYGPLELWHVGEIGSYSKSNLLQWHFVHCEPQINKPGFEAEFILVTNQRLS
jgi:hypothetical protein